MQVSNTLNNSIRILFNPKVETFKLFDFLVVKSNEDRYIAQIIEVYDDKFDVSQNVAKLRIFYKITQNNEVMPYDNFTPNKECEILKIKQEEIEQFINQGKKTFVLGKNVKNSEGFNIQYDFFNNNAVILADKIEGANAISLNIAKNLSEKKHTIIIDSTGAMECKEAKKIKAAKHFKMPLNFTTIDFIFDKCLSDASLEFQATGGQIINEIKSFAKTQETGFISFSAFTKVLLDQYKTTPYPELKLLLTRIKRYQMRDIFATAKKDYEILFKTIKSSPLTIIDLSDVEAGWQKAYLEYIVEDLKDKVYLVTRINDENCDVDLINKIYCKKENITFVPSVSYNYKKLPSIMRYCKNYILMPSLYQRTDFLNANFALSNLISDGCIIFGEDTDDFLYLVNDYELRVNTEQKIKYRKIALSLIEEDDEETMEQQLGERGDYFENIKKENEKKTDSERLIEELSKFEEEKKGTLDSNEKNFQIVEEPEEEPENPEISDFFNDVINNEETVEEEPEEETQEIENEIEEFEENKKSIEDVEVDKDSIELEEMEETSDLDIKKPEKEPKEEPEEELEEEIKEQEEIEEEPEESEETEEPKKDKKFVPKSDPEIGKVNITKADIIDPEAIDLEEMAEEGKTDAERAKEEEAKHGESAESDDERLDLSESSEDSNEALGDDELDFFELAEESKKSENIDLEEIANDSINDNFEEIVNAKPKEAPQTVELDKDIKINADILEKPEENSSLPIFKEEEQNSEMPEFKVGDVIIHPKYGRGKVIKTLTHEKRQLVHVDFENADKKLLDPKVANIKLEQ